ncbi:MAG: TIM barrel protein, partial [Deltaproteobacteria bacterium]|nr:TIM barrel protein [Deltaproteobacteria bacterium]
MAVTSGATGPLVGAHVSTAGGLARVVDNARRIGAEVVQIFPWSPRQWAGGAFGEEEAADLGEQLRSRGAPLFVHAIYLINLATPDPELREKSARALGDALRFGAVSGAQGVVVHVGSH